MVVLARPLPVQSDQLCPCRRRYDVTCGSYLPLWFSHINLILYSQGGGSHPLTMTESGFSKSEFTVKAGSGAYTFNKSCKLFLSYINFLPKKLLNSQIFFLKSLKFTLVKTTSNSHTILYPSLNTFFLFANLQKTSSSAGTHG